MPGHPSVTSRLLIVSTVILTSHFFLRFFFFNDTPTPEIYPLSLHDALPISLVSLLGSGTRRAEASVLISSPAGPAAVTPMLPNLRELATSSVVAGNVRSTLRLTESTEELR